jgi:hypothetical protein
MALGGGRGRLVRQLLTESVVLGFALAVSIITGVIFGLLPAFQVMKTSLRDSLSGSGRATKSGVRSRSILVVTEVALALVMLVGAGLMIRSFTRLMNVDPGFNSDHVLTLQMDIPPATIPTTVNHGAFESPAKRTCRPIGFSPRAERGDVMRLVLGQGMRLVVTGVAIGLAGAFVLTRFLRTLLFETGPTDPITFAGVSILLALVALLACYVPARRASRVDPIAFPHIRHGFADSCVATCCHPLRGFAVFDLYSVADRISRHGFADSPVATRRHPVPGFRANLNTILCC